MHYYTLHGGRKYFCRYCLQVFSTEEVLKSHIKDYFKINSKQRIIMPKNGDFVEFKNYERKIKSPFIICAYFESILVSENNGKQNAEESYTNKYQKHIACSSGYKLVCFDGKFSKPFKTYLGEDLFTLIVLHFINSMIEESKYCREVITKHFNKELVTMTKKKMKILRTILNVVSAIMIILIMMLN